MHIYYPYVRVSLKLQNKKHDFCYVRAHILTSSDCEGAGETFRVTPSSSAPSDALNPPSTPAGTRSAKFFSKPAYLTGSRVHPLTLLPRRALPDEPPPCRVLDARGRMSVDARDQ